MVSGGFIRIAARTAAGKVSASSKTSSTRVGGSCRTTTRTPPATTARTKSTRTASTPTSSWSTGKQTCRARAGTRIQQLRHSYEENLHRSIALRAFAVQAVDTACNTVSASVAGSLTMDEEGNTDDDGT